MCGDGANDCGVSSLWLGGPQSPKISYVAHFRGMATIAGIYTIAVPHEGQTDAEGLGGFHQSHKMTQWFGEGR